MAGRRAVFALIAVGATLLLAELILRLAVPLDYLVFAYERPNGLLLHAEGDRTYLPRPLAEGITVDGPNQWRWRMNADGLREDAEIPAHPPPGQVRYLALGDSWIFGQSADQSADLETDLERILEARTGASVEVINAGVPGAAAYDMLVRWRALRDRYEVQGLVLGAPKNVGRQADVAAERSLWYAGDGAPFLDVYVYLGLRRLLVPLTRSHLRVLDEDAWATMIEDTAILAREAREAGLSVVLGLWPQDRARAMSADPQVPYARFVAALQDTGAVVTGARLGSPSCWGFQDLSHPSEAGYLVLAQILAERMTGGPDPGGLRTSPRCEDQPAIGPAMPMPPRSYAPRSPVK